MKTAIVPAQVTTVEDRIAGNFTFAQLLIVMAAGGAAAAIYLLMAPKFHFNPIKLASVLAVAGLIAPLAIRIQGKIVADWLVILCRFFVRPHRYVFTKNDAATRATPIVEPKQKLTVTTQAKPTKQPVTEPLTAAEHDRAGKLLTNPALAVRFVIAEKGGLDVSLTPVKR